MKPRTTRRLNLLKSVVAVLVIVLIAGTVYTSSLTNPGGDLRGFQSLKADIDKGSYTPTADGVIVLSSSDRMLTLDGLVYVTGNPPELILFPRWRGEGTSINATGWSSRPLRRGDELNANLPAAANVSVASSVPGVPPVAVAKVRVTKELGENWYVFERRGE